MTCKSSSMCASIFFLFALLVPIFVEASWKIPSYLSLTRNCHILRYAEFLGPGQLNQPEDIVYDENSENIYTGCLDGWIKRVYIGKSKFSMNKVENWVNTGGRPLGLVWGLNNELIVADAYKGLLHVTKDGRVTVLTTMAEGLKFNLMDGVDVAKDGKIYFTDSSYKYSLQDADVAFADPLPYGRLVSYDPTTRKTKVLARDLYTPNGIVVSPNQDSVIFCESTKSRCTKYYIRGETKGLTENFIDHLPASVANIKYDNQGQNYWIGLYSRNTSYYNAGALAVTLDGKAIAQFTDFNITCSTATRIGDDVYCSSVLQNFIFRFSPAQLPSSRASRSPFCSR
ncbi:hypothetical protein ACFE04_000773 [Oxalis oulophora]